MEGEQYIDDPGSKESNNKLSAFVSGISLVTCNQKFCLCLSEAQQEQTGLGGQVGLSRGLTYSNMCFQNHTNIICTIPYGEGDGAPFCVLHHSHNL